MLHEPEAGVLRAQKRDARRWPRRRSARGATLVHGRATPRRPHVVLDDGTALEGDRVVWSCGGWLAELFPGLVQLRVTRQELFFFDGGPAWRNAPGWVDYDRAIYGTGDIDELGVKVALGPGGPAARPRRRPPARDRRRSSS